ncbi:MAG: L-Ala-D/L-Glu epimerase [Syntrophorhabdus sp. PtaU1.Bin050]|nr:MAG: L-Ala-D/L-Glu epimerase [Syntrophorhabdus sp. PtaU1.Bin050]
MKIASVEAFPVALPLKKPFSIALGTMTHTSHIIVKVTTDDGIFGFGEGATWHVVYGYDRHALEWAVERYLGPAILGMDPFDIEHILSAMDMALPGNLMAKAGVEIACQDIRGKALGVPLHRLFGGVLMERLETIGFVDIVPPEEAARLAEAFTREGYRFIKIKVGLNAKEDVERVRVVRLTVGPDTCIRVDGNQGYDRASAGKVCRALEPFNLQWIEQPLPYWDIEGLAALARDLTTSIAVDESIYGVHDVYRVAQAHAADIINIKLSKCGGITNSLKVANAAHAMGLSCFLGSCIETGLGSTAALHFAACCPNLHAGIEMDGSMPFKDDILAEPLIPAYGTLPLPQGTGLGADVQPDKLARYSK